MLSTEANPGSIRRTADVVGDAVVVGEGDAVSQERL
jgi:hypothetical protein